MSARTRHPRSTEIRYRSRNTASRSSPVVASRNRTGRARSSRDEARSSAPASHLGVGSRSFAVTSTNLDGGPAASAPTMHRVRLGISPPVEMTGVGEAVRLSARAEALGYTDVFSSEAGHADAFSPLAALAMATATVRLGTALVPVYTRPPALVAMSAAGLHHLSGGRFVLGLGASTPPIVERWMGLAFER